ncbi:MAG: ATP-dependent RecD-like DNA helicase [Chloroflexi bacterium]|nr:ATP-dependent RecD-like DNA helicase [Chloroflexota bacterium]MCY4247449.1 ATP-dependent RecD-like DNA helicase [Chloroflexota bacterium]
MPEQIEGSIERVTFYSADSGYSVLKVKPEQRYPQAQARDGTIAVVGAMPQLGEGEKAQFIGDWVSHPQYGLQFQAQQAIPLPPQTAQGIVNYLSSGIIKGIGPATAQKIVNTLGERTIEILDEEPQRIHEVRGLKPQLAKKLGDIWADNRAMRNVMIYLQGLGISAKIAKRIYERYGATTQFVIDQNPYQLADDVFSIGFRKADQIARSMGLGRADQHRLRAGLHYALNELAREGHTYAPRELLLEKAAELLDIDDGAALEQALREQTSHKALRQDTLQPAADCPAINAIYLPRFFRAESDSAQLLRAIAQCKSQIIADHRNTDWSAYLEDLSQANKAQLSPQQQNAVREALTSKLSVLTGGPGTGKTTTLQMLIHALDEGSYQYSLASPTGRAAKRLGETTGKDASTIHRLLSFSPEDGGFEHDEDNPLPAEMVVIDEASMLDLRLFHSLLRALKPAAHLLLVGDIDQLPSVGAGNVLRDVIDSGIARVTRLDQIFRQDDSSHIVSNAHRINRGRQPYTDNHSKDFFFFNIENPEAVSEQIVLLVRDKLPARDDLDAVRDIQVIAPMYRGAAGVHNLNSRLQAELNGDVRAAELKLGSRIFRVGDKVMQTRNNYDKDVFNGDIGFIHSIDPGDKRLQISMDGRLVSYEAMDLDDLMHAYCISTHRSQGSEYPAVVMPVLTQHWMMLQRNLIYTAITRAKRLVVLVGTRRALKIAVDNDKVAQRHTGLAQRLRALDSPIAKRANDKARQDALLAAAALRTGRLER